MLTNQLLPLETRVWTVAFGSEWRPASQTSLARSSGVMPPPLAATAPQPPIAAPQAVGGYTPPYAAPSDLWAYLLALSPLLFSALEILYYNPFAHAPGDVIPVVGFWIGLLLAWADTRNLNRSRRNPQMRTMVPFVLLTPIGYFWRRRAITRTSLKYLFIWIGCLVFYAVVLAGLSDPQI
ncbi:hypothetical protein WHT83_09315 [Aminobacter sp. P9b]|uniref:hypothetical protein n=1 Tax=Aminobacter sp. P9b TaxID=3133697 RepID=UPI00324615EF